MLDGATGRWGIRVNRLALKATDPPRTIQEPVEKQMRADRDKRGTISADQGASSPRSSRGGREQSATLRAQGEREAQILRAQWKRRPSRPFPAPT